MKEMRTGYTAMAHSCRDDLRAGGQAVPNRLLRDARKQYGWTQQEVADKIGVAVVSVGRWERGEVFPRRYERDLLCELFQKNAQELGFPSAPGAASQEPPQASEEKGTAFFPPVSPAREELIGRPPSFQAQLRHERVMRGWSQADLARRVGCDSKIVVRWETGRSLPSPRFRQRLFELFNKNGEEFGLMGRARGAAVMPDHQAMRMRAGPYSAQHTLSLELPVHCGDCEQSEVTATLETVVIDPNRGCTTFYFRWINGTAEDIGLTFKSLSLTDPRGDFFHGRSVGSFLLSAKQSTPLAVIFDWIPQQGLLYKLHITLVRPGWWRNTYRPIPFTV